VPETEKYKKETKTNECQCPLSLVQVKISESCPEVTRKTVGNGKDL